ncbi:FAD-dependent oxidoreductase [Marinagarivorans cellulosilyticus]|uniref:FAD dependent oxidoreductase domain-containing protein n=1 Tax=Marinagarivorans cellulosilyticus TaxID=2721545 RepID=A0AAN2BKT7_9GAMM|nr:FAD-dependent oxidoreductase [Marinagarivorans cellulosilyticus]BCD98327.1 hypothetical protein MARGE09_P2528 [Marinagarivorans cellulosilyticus]
MSKKIAIIGCGVFGASVALKLKELGYDVSVFEKKSAILNGASLNNQNRLHLGFHYPRDDETAQQCIAGFQRFIDEYPGSITEVFPNAYFIAQDGSFTSPDNYISFCERNGLGYQRIDKNNFDIKVCDVDLGILCEERVYDSKLLAKIISQKLRDQQISINLNSTVTSVNFENGVHRLRVNNLDVGAFDAVVNCSYADINRITNQLGFETQNHQYEYTVVPVVDTKLPRVGVTIMDGPFMTLLPFGASSHSLLYHVENTVIARETGQVLNPEWLDETKNPFTRIDLNDFFNSMLEKCKQYIPSVAGAELVGFLHGPRMVLAKKDDTDARPSMINSYSNNYHTVFSGKIDHCVWVADEVAERINREFQ